MKKFLLTCFGCLTMFLSVQLNANATALFFTDATYPVTATGVDVCDLSDLKRGQSSSINILWLVEVGDASIDKAAKDAGITKIRPKQFNILTVKPEETTTLGASNNVRMIYEDDLGHIWIGTKNGSLYIYDNTLKQILFNLKGIINNPKIIIHSFL